MKNDKPGMMRKLKQRTPPRSAIDNRSGRRERGNTQKIIRSCDATVDAHCKKINKKKITRRCPVLMSYNTNIKRNLIILIVFYYCIGCQIGD